MFKVKCWQYPCVQKCVKTNFHASVLFKHCASKWPVWLTLHAFFYPSTPHPWGNLDFCCRLEFSPTSIVRTNSSSLLLEEKFWNHNQAAQWLSNPIMKSALDRVNFLIPSWLFSSPGVFPYWKPIVMLNPVFFSSRAEVLTGGHWSSWRPMSYAKVPIPSTLC